MFVGKYPEKKPYFELSNDILKLQSGTKFIGFLKEDQSNFLEERRPKHVVMKHSEFIGSLNDLFVKS